MIMGWLRDHTSGLPSLMKTMTYAWKIIFFIVVEHESAFSLLPKSFAIYSQVEELKDLFYVLTAIIGQWEEWFWWHKSILRTDCILQEFFKMT